MDILIRFYNGKPKDNIIKETRNFFEILGYECDEEGQFRHTVYDMQGFSLKTDVFEMTFIKNKEVKE